MLGRVFEDLPLFVMGISGIAIVVTKCALSYKFS